MKYRCTLDSMTRMASRAKITAPTATCVFLDLDRIASPPTGSEFGLSLSQPHAFHTQGLAFLRSRPAFFGDKGLDAAKRFAQHFGITCVRKADMPLAIRTESVAWNDGDTCLGEQSVCDVL